MVSYPSHLKHTILKEYVVGDRAHSFAALAHKYNIKGGKKLIQTWYAQWDGTASSLERRKGSGRRALLTQKQINKLIVKPIRRANQSHVAIEYPELKEAIVQEIGHPISARSIRRYGHDSGGVRASITTPRTEQECKSYQHILFLPNSPLKHSRTHQDLLLKFHGNYSVDSTL